MHALVKGVCTFNDDIQSTAAAVVGAVYGALRLEGVPPLKDQVFLFFGAGQANIGTARLLVAALIDEGLTEAEAKKQMWLYDSKASQLLTITCCVLSCCLSLAMAEQGDKEMS
jgi:malic enzyme